MCDPISAIALAGSAVAAGISYQGQQETQQAQQQANDDWVATQRAAAATAAAKDAANREKAQGALSTSEAALSPANQGVVQQNAATNLNNAMLAGSPAGDANIAALGGPSADTSVTSDMSQRITNAAREARGRIAAEAAVASYGGGYGDMGAAATQNLANSGDVIGLTSNMRRGDTATLGIAQNVQPVHYAQGSDIAGTVASGLAGIAGSAFAKNMTMPKTPTA